MIQLLHREIDVTPGAPPRQEARKEGSVGLGRALLRIENDSKVQNAYKIWVECDDPLWNPAWCVLKALDRAKTDEDDRSWKPDERGVDNEYVKVYLLAYEVRDIALDFVVPRMPDSRAGVYRFRIYVEVSASDKPGANPYDDQPTPIEAAAIIRPFFEWSAQMRPSERSVGTFRRRTRYELRVENKGNDWLYLDLLPLESDQVRATTPAQRIAVPPKDKDIKVPRDIPIASFCPQRVWKGRRESYPVEVTLSRVDAPSVPPLSELAQQGDADAGLGNAVVPKDTKDGPTDPYSPGRLFYNPIIPATFLDFLRWIGQNAKGLFFAILGFIVAMHLFLFMYTNLVGKIEHFDPLESTWHKGQRLHVRGTWLTSSEITATDLNGKEIRKFTPLPDPNLDPKDQKVSIEWDDRLLEYPKIKLVAQRAVMLSWLPGLPKSKDVFVEIEGGAKVPLAHLAPDSVEGKPYAITLENFPPDLVGGIKVMINGQPAQTSRSGNILYVTLPPGLTAGRTFRIEVRAGNDQKVQLDGDDKVSVVSSLNASDAAKAFGDAPPEGATPQGGAPAGGGVAPGAPGARAVGPPGYTGAVGALAKELAGDKAGAQAAFAAAAAQATGSDAASAAIRAFSLAGAGNAAEAKTALAQAQSGAGSAGDGVRSLLAAAQARVAEADGKDPGDLYDEARTLARRDPAFLLPYLAAAASELARGSAANARTVLKSVPENAHPTAEESAALGALPG